MLRAPGARSLPLFFAWGRLWLRAEGVGWYGKMNDIVIYGMMYQVRKQMGGGLHKVCYDGAGDDAGESGQEGAGEGVSGFLNFGGYVVDAERVEDGFGAAEDEGSGQAGGGVGAVLFVEVEEETGGGAGGEHFYDGEGNQGRGEAGGFQKVFEEGCEGIQEAGGTQDPCTGHQTD